MNTCNNCDKSYKTHQLLTVKGSVIYTLCFKCAVIFCIRTNLSCGIIKVGKNCLTVSTNTIVNFKKQVRELIKTSYVDQDITNQSISNIVLVNVPVCTNCNEVINKEIIDDEGIITSIFPLEYLHSCSTCLDERITKLFCFGPPNNENKISTSNNNGAEDQNV